MNYTSILVLTILSIYIIMKAWKDYVNEVIAEFKKAGKKVKLTEVLPIAKKRRDAAEGKHPHKGQASKTRKGRKDFVTHKGDKKFNRKGHRQSRAKGSKTRRAPYKGRGGDTGPVFPGMGLSTQIRDDLTQQAVISDLVGAGKHRASKRTKRVSHKRSTRKH